MVLQVIVLLLLSRYTPDTRHSSSRYHSSANLFNLSFIHRFRTGRDKDDLELNADPV